MRQHFCRLIWYYAFMFILGNISALAYMRLVGAEEIASLRRVARPQSLGPLETSKAASLAASSFLQAVGLPPCEIHLISTCAQRRRDHSDTVFHTFSEIPRNALLQVDDGVCIASPELLFLQLARTADLLDVIQIGFELCGIYPHPGQVFTSFGERKSFMTKQSCERYLAHQNGIPGLRRARAAIKHVIDRSASPMETASAIMLGLPYRLGGLGFPKFTMNEKIAVPLKMQHELGRSEFYGDLAWIDQRVILEYESNMYHSGAQRIASDSSRRNALSRMDYRVVTLTGNQIYDAQEFLRTAKTLASLLGHRIQPRVDAFEMRHQSLRHAVLKDQASTFRISA